MEIPVNANSVDPDGTPYSVTSDLDLHYFQMSLLCDARHKMFNILPKGPISIYLPFVVIKFRWLSIRRDSLSNQCIQNQT